MMWLWTFLTGSRLHYGGEGAFGSMAAKLRRLAINIGSERIPEQAFLACPHEPRNLMRPGVGREAAGRL